MDEISREFLPDTTTPGVDKRRSKGPDEAVVLDRSYAAEDDPTAAVLHNRFSGSNRVSGEASAGTGKGGPDSPSEPLADAELAAPEVGLEPDGDAELDGISAADAAVAVAAGEETAMVEEEIESVPDEEGLPPVPELQDIAAIARVVFVLMLTQREGMSVLRLAQACNTTQKLIEQALDHLGGELKQLGLPVEMSRTGESVRWMSAPDAFPYLQRLRGVKKMEKLSAAALETLAVIAYRQPVMRAEIEAIRGVKAGPMLRTLLQHKLVKVTGRADVPGRPLQYGTSQQFLERFGLASLQELPSLKEFKQLG